MNEAAAPSTYKTQMCHNRFTIFVHGRQDNEMHLQQSNLLQLHANTGWRKAVQ